MKKGFTLSEVLITLVVLGVIMAITIPVLNNVRPDPDKTMYQKALYSVQGAMSSVMNDPMANLSRSYWADSEVTASGFCDAFAEALNTVGDIDCTSESSYDAPNFITSDGLRFWGLEGKSFTATDSRGNNVRDIYVDRLLSKNEKNKLETKRDTSHANPGLKIQITASGKVQTGNTDDWEYENSITKKFIMPHNG